jgi:hypothetical protein
MNRCMKTLSIALLAIAAWVTFSLNAQTYSFDWFKVAGGGGISTGGVFTVSGTIGQHDAGGPLTGGNFSVVGGFWSLIVVQTTGAPTLKIFLTTTNTAVVSWPSPSPNWRLQENPSPSGSSWITPTETVNDNGTEKFIVVNPVAGSRFYRLTSP